MLRGNKAIVTGASRGVGFAIAQALISEGCKVVITGRNESTLKDAAQQLGENAFPLVWDLSNLADGEARFKEAVDVLGGVDIFVNNAAILLINREYNKKDVLQMTVDEWEQVITVNASAVFFNMQMAVKYMLENNVKGNVLNISSSVTEMPIYGSYRASKLMVTGLTRGWGQLYARDGIIINGIAPGPIATAMVGWKEGDTLEWDGVPIGRRAKPEEVAQMAIFMLSKQAEMTCGEMIKFDGAYAIR